MQRVHHATPVAEAHALSSSRKRRFADVVSRRGVAHNWGRPAMAIAIDPIWFAVAAYAAGAIVVAVLLAKYFRK